MFFLSSSSSCAVLSLSPRAFFFRSRFSFLLSIVDILVVVVVVSPHLLINCPSVICSLLSCMNANSSRKKEKRRKKNIQIFNWECYCIFEFFCHCYIADHLDTLSKSPHCTFERLFFIIDRKSRHINRMNNIQMEIDIYFPIQLRALLLFRFFFIFLSDFFISFYFIFVSFCVVVCCFVGWCAQKVGSSGEILQQ